MENDMAIKILRMREHYCSWENVAERFGESYTSAERIRDSLRLWAKLKGVDVNWAFPQLANKGNGIWGIEPPKGWLKEIEKKLGRFGKKGKTETTH
tara:strand:+ start:546 stop:833 length:288 start_codon:yes stop_codon:yes gene_type:complete